jgi:YD repeat-containing protein
VREEGASKLTYTDGLLTHVDGEFADERYEYDSDAQLVEHRRTIGGRTFTTRISYDAHGRLSTRELPSGTRLRYDYASNGALLSVVQERWRGDRVLVQSNETKSAKPKRLDASGSLAFGNGIATRTSFDARKFESARD